MIDYNKIFLDTSPIIYFLDEDINYGDKVKIILETFLAANKKLVTSTITCEEYLVYPYKTNNTEKIEVFFDFILDCNIPLSVINLETAKKAAAIRAKYKNFKAMDALQLASACIQNCDLFLTNDKQLKQFTELPCLTIDDYNVLG